MSHRLGMNLWGSIALTFSVGVAAVAAPHIAAPAENLPGRSIVREAADPATGVGELAAGEQASWDAEQLRRFYEWAAEQERATQAERDRQARAARLAAARAATAAADRSSRSAPAGKQPADGTSVWVVLADCESGDGTVGPPYSWSNPRGTYSGPFQFADATWQSLGYSGRAADHDYATQLAGAQRLQARSGWGQWPSCTRRMRAGGYLP